MKYVQRTTLRPVRLCPSRMAGVHLSAIPGVQVLTHSSAILSLQNTGVVVLAMHAMGPQDDSVIT